MARTWVIAAERGLAVVDVAYGADVEVRLVLFEHSSLTLWGSFLSASCSGPK